MRRVGGARLAVASVLLAALALVLWQGLHFGERAVSVRRYEGEGARTAVDVGASELVSPDAPQRDWQEDPRRVSELGAALSTADGESSSSIQEVVATYLSGEVRDAESRSVKILSAEVFARGPATTPGGLPEVRILADRFATSLELPRGVPQDVTLAVTACGFDRTEARLRVIGGEDQRTLCVVVRAPAPIVYGEVVDARGQPVSEAVLEIRLRSGTLETESATTNSEGKFAFRCSRPESVLDLIVRQPRFAARYVDETSSGGWQAMRIALVEGSTLKGRLVSSRGVPLEGIHVIAVPSELFVPSEVRRMEPQTVADMIRARELEKRVGAVCYSDEKGQFRLDHIEAGSHSLEFFAPGSFFESPISLGVESVVMADEDQEREFVLAVPSIADAPSPEVLELMKSFSTDSGE